MVAFWHSFSLFDLGALQDWYAIVFLGNDFFPNITSWPVSFLKYGPLLRSMVTSSEQQSHALDSPRFIQKLYWEAVEIETDESSTEGFFPCDMCGTVDFCVLYQFISKDIKSSLSFSLAFRSISFGSYSTFDRHCLFHHTSMCYFLSQYVQEFPLFIRGSFICSYSSLWEYCHSG